MTLYNISFILLIGSEIQIVPILNNFPENCLKLHEFFFFKW